MIIGGGLLFEIAHGGRSMRYIINNCKNPYYNIALEEYCLMNIDVGEDYFILWQNEPAIIVGKNQNTLEEINTKFVEENDVKVVRRISGGGAVYHDLGNLNYTFITSINDAENTDFRKYAQPIINILRELSVEAELSGRNDITVMGKKVSGNAQRLHRKKFMQHGTLLFDLNIDNLVQALNVSMDKIESKGIKSVRSRVGNIREFLKEDMDIESFKELLQRRLSNNYASKEIVLTEKDIKIIEDSAKNKFSTWDWNYGESPEFDYKGEKRFPGGKIGVLVKVKDGLMKDCKFYGDFLALLDTEPVIKKLKGLKYEKETIEKALKEIELDKHFGSITLGELLEVFFG